MTNTKNDIYIKLVLKGRELVVEKGTEFLTARKLSEASGCSVGTIYNQFLNMDNFIIVQNMLTLDKVYESLEKVERFSNPYDNINKYLDCFVSFVAKNANLWALLYEFHLKKREGRLPEEYMRKIARVMKVMFADFAKISKGVKEKERRILKRVIWLSMFSMSPFLTNDLFEGFNDMKRETVCKLLLNTYLAGVSSL